MTAVHARCAGARAGRAGQWHREAVVAAAAALVMAAVTQERVAVAARA